MKKAKNADFIIYIHSFLLLWAVAFLVCLQSYYLRNALSVLAFGNIAFLFFNIPFSIISFVLNAKGFISKKYAKPLAVASVLNILVGIAAWMFAAAVLSTVFI